MRHRVRLNVAEHAQRADASLSIRMIYLVANVCRTAPSPEEALCELASGGRGAVGDGNSFHLDYSSMSANRSDMALNKDIHGAGNDCRWRIPFVLLASAAFRPTEIVASRV